MRARRIGTGIVLAIGISSAAPWSRDIRAAHSDNAGLMHGPLIVKLVGRAQTITVTAGPSGPLYSAVTTSGKVLVSNATLEQLRSDFPEIYHQIAPATAEARELDARAE